MAITVDRPNYEILVPRTDMTLVQSTPVEIRELDTNAFRLILRDLDDDPNGRAWPITHDHNTDVDIDGINYARQVLIREPYTVTFEDGQYVVQIKGSNNNILGRTNKNQVSVSPSNSAGLISSSDIEYSQYANGIYVDQSSTYSGTLHPKGTLREPVNNLGDAHIIAEFRGVQEVKFLGNGLIGVTDDFTNYIFHGQNANLTYITVETQANVVNCEFKECTITGVLDGGSIIRDAVIYDLNYVNGVVFNTMLGGGTIQLGGSAVAHFLNCYSGVPGESTPIVDMGGSGQSLAFRNYNGGIKLINKTGVESVSLDLNSGQAILDNTVTNGVIVCRGVGKLIDINGDHIPSGTWNGVTIVNETTGYLLSSGGSLTVEQAIQLAEIYEFSGFKSGVPMRSKIIDDTPGYVKTDNIEIEITKEGDELVVTRQP